MKIINKPNIKKNLRIVTYVTIQKKLFFLIIRIIIPFNSNDNKFNNDI
jgi:hypothetical protein